MWKTNDKFFRVLIYRKVSKKKAQDWCEKNGGLIYFETSAKDGTGVNDAFVALGEHAILNK